MTMRAPIGFRVSHDELDAIVARAREQEAVYGHNTGHFTLKAEKENTITGVIGEWAVRRALRETFATDIGVTVDFAPIGAPFDVTVSRRNFGEFGVHVKTGRWRRWPKDEFAFGVHADQGIQDGSQPLVLVSVLRREDGYPNEGRIEGFVSARQLRSCEVVQQGDRFPVSGVESRTTNLVTYIGQFERLAELRRLIASELALETDQPDTGDQ